MHDQPALESSVDPPPTRLVHLRRSGVSVVLAFSDDSLPAIVHWGAQLPDDEGLQGLSERAISYKAADTVDTGVRSAIIAEPAGGWTGRPGVSGHWAGQLAIAPFIVQSVDASEHALEVAASADDLDLALTIELAEGGLLRQRAGVRNSGDANFTLDDVSLSVPTPGRAVEVLDFAGGHMRERMPQRARWDVGSRTHESRRGRPGLQSATTVVVGESGFSFSRGEVWGVHVAWSGNHRMVAEHTTLADKTLFGGELLLPGEVVLAPGESYESPWVVFSYGEGLDEYSGRFHEWLRSVPGRRTRPRPVTLNTWEAVYFDQSIERLAPLVDAAAAAGVERFVLDDGWFGDRRDDTRGLGDWEVSRDIWPEGLEPLVRRVRDSGMEFGLWVEPEMVNVDSELFRQHPEWVLGRGARQPSPQRHQLVLDLAHPDAYAHIHERLATLVRTYDIAYLKWDHNRDLVEPIDAVSGRARVRAQTLALYSLLEELRTEFPALEIESCASGGGRVDLGILERTDRIWASDSLDPIERQRIQRWTGLLVPPELVGSHVGKGRLFDSGRVTPLDFRAMTAVFGHFGAELDLVKLSDQEFARVAEWVAYAKTIRPLLATGRTVRGDDSDPARVVHGVVDPSGMQALFSVAMTAVSAYRPSFPVTLEGLRPEALYTVRLAAPLRNALCGHALADGVTMSGAALRRTGIRVPALRPAEGVLLEVAYAAE